MDVASHREPTIHAMQTHRSTMTRGGAASGGSTSGGFNSCKTPKCSYCEGSHPVDRCYFLIGFPEGHKWHGKRVLPRNKRTNPTAHNVEVSQSQSNFIGATTATSSNGPTFTNEEYHQLLALLRSGNGKITPLANATGTGAALVVTMVEAAGDMGKGSLAASVMNFAMREFAILFKYLGGEKRK
ncbi:hypothetical protein DKX38_017343 [Salix brachista]|uniref:Uncharacterized protein n=1 Tax=Salix brachista TaxID=2182728 RepID=A0A5N5KV21_9ROSI|nr:hypothetical protein DKX38_017343 [Salix brachista]